MKLRKCLMGVLLGCLTVAALSVSAFAMGDENIPSTIQGIYNSDYVLTRYSRDYGTGNYETEVYPYNEHGDCLATADSYEYDETGRKVTEMIWGDGYQRKNTYTYDSNNNVATQLIYYQEELSTTWTPGEKSEYTYNSNNNVTTQVTYEWQNNDWKIYSKEEYIYDAHGKMTSMSSYYWNDEKNTWNNNSVIEYEYNSYGDITAKKEAYQTTEYEYVYNNGVKTKMRSYITGKNGVKNLDFECTYDKNGNPTEGYIYYTTSNGEIKLDHNERYVFAKKSEIIHMPFADISENNWYTQYVRYVSQMSLMNGTSATTFEPQSPLSRAMVAQILYNRAGQPEVSGQPRFSDVAKDQWYYNAIQWASEQGIVSGIGDGKFAPNANVTREQLAMMLYNAQEKPETDGSLSGFEDTNNVSDWAVNAVEWAVQEKIINGSESQGKLYINPNGNATRAEAATMITNYDQKF